MDDMVKIGGAEFARFVRDEMRIIGVFEGGKSQRFANRRAPLMRR